MVTLIIGAGLSGAAVAHQIFQAKRDDQKEEVIVWEQDARAGGRMVAKPFPNHPDIAVDVGAQYLSTKSAEHEDIRSMLLQAGELVPFDEASIHNTSGSETIQNVAVQSAVSPHAFGFQHMIEYLLQGASVSYNTTLSQFKVTGDKIRAIAANEQEITIDHLVLTCPTPSLLSILDKSPLEVDQNDLSRFEHVSYSQRFAAGFLFDASISSIVDSLGFTGKYVDGNPIVRYISWDNVKKQKGEETFYSLLVHTSVGYGMQQIKEKRSEEEVLQEIQRAVKQVLPDLPSPKDKLLQPWQISQVHQRFSDAHDVKEKEPMVTVSRHPPILIANDAILGSGFDNCLTTAKATARFLFKNRNKL